jgi:hypothetical protein
MTMRRSILAPILFFAAFASVPQAWEYAPDSTMRREPAPVADSTRHHLTPPDRKGQLVAGGVLMAVGVGAVILGANLIAQSGYCVEDVDLDPATKQCEDDSGFGLTLMIAGSFLAGIGGLLLEQGLQPDASRVSPGQAKDANSEVNATF